MAEEKYVIKATDNAVVGLIVGKVGGDVNVPPGTGLDGFIDTLRNSAIGAQIGGVDDNGNVFNGDASTNLAVGAPVVPGHAFLSYAREDSAQVDRLQRMLHDAGIPVWRDTSDLWPGENWQSKVREAITDGALAFIACFSRSSVARVTSYQNEELVLAAEQLRLRRPDRPWLIPVRFDDCEIPDRDIAGGLRLSSLQRVDLFGDAFDEGAARLVAAIRRILGPS